MGIFSWCTTCKAKVLHRVTRFRFAEGTANGSELALSLKCMQCGGTKKHSEVGLTQQRRCMVRHRISDVIHAQKGAAIA